MKAYEFQIELREVKPPVRRRFIVHAGIAFFTLHEVIQTVMGWDNAHLYSFRFPKSGVQIVPQEDMIFETERLDDEIIDAYVEDEKKFRYDYDFGDDWEHVITLKKVITDYAEDHPKVLSFEGNCPPEDCGGPYGYRELVAILADPKHEEYQERMEWLGDPSNYVYDLEEVNLALSEWTIKTINIYETPEEDWEDEDPDFME